MKIAAYCRVSTDKDQQMDSLKNQKEFFASYAKRNGHELFRLYADEGISGTSLKKREEFKRLLLDAQLGLFEMVVVKDISRFARNTVDALQSIRKLKSMGINTLFLSANMDSMGDSEFVLTLFSAMAQEESNNLSKRVKWGKRINAEKGRVPRLVFGYDRVDKFTLEINPGEAQIVQKIFSLYIDQGLGCRSISMVLNRDQDKTKLGNTWDARGVRRVLVNPLYCGVLINHKYEIEDFLTGKQIPIPQEEQFIHSRASWAIVSPETFQKAQEIMADRRIQYNSGEPFKAGRYSCKHLFSTLIKCEHCGRSFTRKSYTYVNTRVYWRCVTNDQYTAEKCDNHVILEEPELIEQIRRYLASQVTDRDAFLSRVLADLNKHIPQTEDRSVKDLESQRKKLRSKQDRYREMYANDLIDMEQLKQKLRELKALEAGLDKPLQTAKPVGEEILKSLNMETLTNLDLRRIIDYISVNQNGKIRIVIKKNTTWRNDVHSRGLRSHGA